MLIICKNIVLVFAFDLCKYLCQTSQIWPISYFQPILAAIFVTLATAKVKINRDFYTLAFVLINLHEENGDKQCLYFSLIGEGGCEKPLNARSSLSCS